MISKTIGYNGVHYFQTNPYVSGWIIIFHWPSLAGSMLIIIFHEQWGRDEIYADVWLLQVLFHIEHIIISYYIYVGHPTYRKSDGCFCPSVVQRQKIRLESKKKVSWEAFIDSKMQDKFPPLLFIIPHSLGEQIIFEGISMFLLKSQTWMNVVSTRFQTICISYIHHHSRFHKQTPSYPLVRQHSCGKSPFLIGKSTINEPFRYVCQVNLLRTFPVSPFCVFWSPAQGGSFILVITGKFLCASYNVGIPDDTLW